MVCGLDCDWPRPKIIKLGLGQAKLVVKVADNCLSRPLPGLAVHCQYMSNSHLGFRSFKGKVLELLSPNLVCRLIGSVACLGLLLAVVPLLLTE